MKLRISGFIIFALLILPQIYAKLWSVGCGIIENDGIYELIELNRPYFLE